MVHGAGESVGSDAVVTHVGGVNSTKIGAKFGRTEFRFQERPRCEPPENYVSVYVARLTLDDAVRRISMEERSAASEGEAARYANVGALIDAGFAVTYEPEFGDDHAGVKYEGDWNDDTARKFDSCFVEYVRCV